MSTPQTHTHDTTLMSSLMLQYNSLRLRLTTQVYRSRSQATVIQIYIKLKSSHKIIPELQLYLKPQLMLTTATAMSVWILVAVFYSLYLYPKSNTEIQRGPKYKVHTVAKYKYNYRCFLLGYVTTLDYLTYNYQVKH